MSQLLSVKQTSSGKIITIGDSKSSVTKITGTQESGGIEFMEENVERVWYEKAPGIAVDYLNDQVIALRILDESGWETANGLCFGMPKAEAEKLCADIPYMETSAQGSIYISYDENLNPIPYDEETATYLFRMEFEDGVVRIIAISHNLQLT